MGNFSIGDIISQFSFKPVEKVPEKAPVDRWFDEFKEWLAGGYETTVHPPRKPGLHASGLGKICARRNVLVEAFGISPVPNTAGNYLTFDVGHALHFWWQERYLGPKQELYGDWMCVACLCTYCGKERALSSEERCKGCRGTGRKVTRGLMPMNCECGVPWQDAIRYMELPVVNEELGYVGHTDGVLIHSDKRRLFEFKTISPSEYKKLEDGPKEDHVIQAHAYMGPLGLDEALIVYENKGSQCAWSVDMFGQFVAGEPKVVPFIIKFDENIWNPIADRIANHHESVEFIEGLKRLDKRPSRDDISRFPRVCVDKKCEMADRCPVSRECFGLD